MPWITPKTFTSTAQRQSFTWCCHSAPSEPDGIPALLHTRWTAPNRRSVTSRRCSTDSSCETSVGHAEHARPRWLESSCHGRVEQRLVDVGQDDLHALGQEPLAQCPPDAAAAAGDDGGLAPQVLHGTYEHIQCPTEGSWIGTSSSPPTVMQAPTCSTTGRTSKSRYHDDFDEWAANFVSPYGDLVRPTPTATGTARVRMRELEADGVVAEIVYPNTIPPFYRRGSLVATAPSADDFELRLAGLRAHNRWLAEWCAEYPSRRAGVGQILLNDVDEAVRDVHWIADHDLRGGVLLPGVPPTRRSRRCTRAATTRCGAACEERGVVLSAHGGSSSPDYGEHPASLSLWLVEAAWFSHRPLWTFILSGVFDRFPAAAAGACRAGQWVDPRRRSTSWTTSTVSSRRATSA